MKDEQKGADEGKPSLFPETQWTVLLEPIRTQSPDAQLALNGLCERYRKPLLALATFKLKNLQDAEDVTHSFLLSLLERRDLERVDRNKGRFRAFLRVCLTNYIHNWRRKDRRSSQVCLEDAPAEALAEDEALTRHYDLEWAFAILEHALNLEKSRYEGLGKLEWFESFRSLLPGAPNASSQTEVASRLGWTVNRVRVEYHRFRDRLEQSIRKEIRLTVSDDKEFEAELMCLKRYLGGIL